MCKIILLVLGFLGAGGLYAQILNIEKIRLDSLNQNHPYQINLEAKFNLYNRSASADSRASFASFTSELNGVLAPNEILYITLAKLSYTENNGTNIINNGYAHFRANFRYQNTWSEEGYAQIQYDHFRGLKKRYLLGLAERLRLFNSEQIALHLGSGPMVEHEVWKHPESGRLIRVNFLKLSTYFIARWTISEIIDFNTILYYQVGYDTGIDATRNRISSTTHFNCKISERISFTASISMAYEDKPIIPITGFIYTVENGLILTF